MDYTPSMRSYLIVWAGQTFSRFGTYMTAFALLSIWVWEQTGQATMLALLGVATTLASAAAAFFGGVIVDRYPRKMLMIAADLIAALVTLGYLLLLVYGHLQMWHLFVGSIVAGFFAQIHDLSWLAATSMMIPKDQYARSGSLRYLSHYGAVILSPALAGALYVRIGLEGIMLFDLLTVIAAVVTVIAVQIPQPVETKPRGSKWAELTYGFRYVRQSPALLAILLNMTLFSFAYNIGATMHTPLILARSHNNVALLAALGSAAGIGGLVGAALMSAWGGPKRLIHGWLLGSAWLGIIRAAFSLGRSAFVWIPTQFATSTTLPVSWGASQGIFLAKVAPDIQGRFFGVQQIVMLLASGLAKLVAGPAADHIFEPAMQPGGILADVLGAVFGTGPGAGFALLSFLSSAAIVVTALSGYGVAPIRDIETTLPDHDTALHEETATVQA